MLRGKVRVKGLGAKFGGVKLKPVGSHQRERAEPPNVPVVNRASVLENELHSRVRALPLGEVAAIDEERAGESRLDDEPIAGRQVEDDQLRAPPTPRDRCARGALCDLARRNLAEDVV